MTSEPQFKTYDELLAEYYRQKTEIMQLIDRIEKAKYDINNTPVEGLSFDQLRDWRKEHLKILEGKTNG